MSYNSDLQYVGNTKSENYNTQRDNKRHAWRACNVTSYAMNAKRAGYVIPHKEGQDWADSFMEIMERPELYEEMENTYDWAVRWEENDDGELVKRYNVRPSQIHAYLSREFNKLVGYDATVFSTSTTIQEMLWTLFNGGAVSLSGDFPYNGSTIGHIVALSHIGTTQPDIWKIESLNQIDSRYIEKFVIDDPWGDFHTNYQDHDGNNVHMSREEFVDIIKHGSLAGTYWAHRMRPNPDK